MSTSMWASPLLLLLISLSAALAGANFCKALRKKSSNAYQRCDQCVINCYSHHHRGRRESAEEEDEPVAVGSQLGLRALCPFTLEHRRYGDVRLQVATEVGDGGRRCRRLGRACTALTIEVTYQLDSRQQTDAVPVAYVCASASAADATDAVTQPSLAEPGRRRRNSGHRRHQRHQRHQQDGPGHQTSPRSRHRRGEPGH